MTVDDLIDELKKISEQGQGHIPVVDNGDSELTSLEVNDDPTLAVVLEF